jgi:hypothetical protein
MRPASVVGGYQFPTPSPQGFGDVLAGCRIAALSCLAQLHLKKPQTSAAGLVVLVLLKNAGCLHVA